MKEAISHTRISAYQSLMEVLEDKLQSLSPINYSSIHDDIWKFTYQGVERVIDFSYFNAPYTQLPSGLYIAFNNDMVNISTNEFAKLLWLYMREGQETDNGSIKTLEVLALLFGYCAHKQKNCIAESELEDFFAYLLNHNPTMQGLEVRFSPPAYRSRLHFFNIKRLLQVFKTFECTPVLPLLHNNSYKNALNNSCLKVLGMTLSDYQKGGSFNLLGLDTGRHYIDFCSLTFEDHIAYATACRLTINDISTVTIKGVEFKYIKRLCAEILMGSPIDSIMSKDIKKIPSNTKINIENIVHDIFFKNYDAAVQQTQLFKLETINTIIKKLELPELRFDNQEFVRSMLFARYYGENGKSRTNIMMEFIASLRTSTPELKLKPQWTLSSFDAITDSVALVEKIHASSRQAFFKKHHTMCDRLQYFDKASNCFGVKKLVRALLNIESAGITLFVALTGWRSSEFGFSLNNININVNKDVLDSTYSPYQFHVKWTVQKTSKKTPLMREITLSSYLLATQLAALNQAGNDKPCLYSMIRNSDSRRMIQNRIGRVWEGFILHYSLCEDLDELENLLLLQKHSAISNTQKNDLIKLSKTYDLQQSQTQSLLELKDNLRSELPLYALTNQSALNSFGKKLKAYQSGSLEIEEQALLEKHLSDETKKSLKFGITLDQATVGYIKSELLQNSVHPTPHAFRHIWAEAVLRRYRGDVGRFIRANFKHLDESFFMAYLQDKETRSVYEVSQRNVINDTVRQHLSAQKDDQRNYTGGFDIYLNKLVNITNIVSNEDYIQMAKKVSDRVISIKSNPWVTCILRNGTESTAKCSKNGTPQRRNASPKLCLGCINADITEGNYIGIVVYTSSDVAACRNPELPAFIKIQHIPVLKSAISQVKKLRNNSKNEKYDKFTSYLQESIDIAQQTIEEAK